MRIRHAVGPITVVSDGLPGVDDFALDNERRSSIATHPGSMNIVDEKGNERAAVDEIMVLDPTSAAFGCGSDEQEGLLYVTLNVVGKQVVVSGVL